MFEGGLPFTIVNAKTRKHFLAGIKTKEEIGWDVQTMPSSLILGYRFHSLKNKVGQLLWPSSFPFGMFFIRLRYPCRSSSLANSSLGGTVGGVVVEGSLEELVIPTRAMVEVVVSNHLRRCLSTAHLLNVFAQV